MPERKQARRSDKNASGASGRAAALPTDQEDWLHSAPDAENISAPLLEQARINPAALKPHQVLQLQRTIGNRAVNNLIARKPTTRPAPVAIQRDYQETEDDTLVADHDSDAGLETAIAREIEAVPAGAVQRGFFSRTKKSKGNADQGATNEVTQTGLAGLTAGGLYLSVSRAIDLLKGAKDAGGQVFKSALGEVGNLLRGMAVPGFLGLIKHIYDAITTYIGMQGLKDAFDNLKAKEQNAALTPDEVKLKEAAGHGFGKVRRRFWLKVYHIISSIVKITAHFITVLSGGTAAMVSELVAIGASVLEGIQKLVMKAKGFYKWIVNKRGKHRKESADTIVDLGLNRDQNALKILIDLDAYSTMRDIKKGLVHGHGGVDTPTTPTEMYNLLVTFRDDPDKYGSLEEYKKDVMKKLKSQ